MVKKGGRDQTRTNNNYWQEGRRERRSGGRKEAATKRARPAGVCIIDTLTAQFQGYREDTTHLVFQY